MKYAAIVLIAVIIAVGFLGLPMLLSGEHHHGCPLMQVHAVLCESTVVEHQALWHVLLATILLLLAALGRYDYGTVTRLQEKRIDRPLRHIDIPLLMRELYASGILNRKEAPYAHCSQSYSVVSTL